MPSFEHRTDRGNASLRDRVVAELRRRDGDACWFCGDPLLFGFGARASARRVTVEHLLPVAYGGPLWALWNLVLAHHRCNGLAADYPLAVKLRFRDALRQHGGWKAMTHAGGGRKMLALAGAANVDPRKRKDRYRSRRRQRDAVRWRQRVAGHPGSAKRPLATILAVARIRFWSRA